LSDVKGWIVRIRTDPIQPPSPTAQSNFPLKKNVGKIPNAPLWACDFFCVQTITFRTLYVFFVIHHASRQVLHVHVLPHPTAEWTAQQIVECCGLELRAATFFRS
jgi:hypothetical protein